MSVNLKSQLIDAEDPNLRIMLEQLQGNILKGHGRDHTCHLFLRFHDDIAKVRQGLGNLGDGTVTSAWRQHIESSQFKESGGEIPGSLFCSVLITASGYRSLGFTQDQINAGFPEEAGDFGVLSNFREGMRAHAPELGDRTLDSWEEPYASGRIDAMVLLGDDDSDFLKRQARIFVNRLEAFADILKVEAGHALRTESGEGIEHFGYVDGRSQPIYFASDMATEGGTTNWNPAEPLERVLVPDLMASPEGGAIEDAFGSYFVFRKLEQDVRRFKMAEQNLADTLNLPDADRERAGAMVVGRFEDGTPVVLSATDGFSPVKENNFNFANDPTGLKCPFAAHIRKANPRGDIARLLVPGGDDETLERRRRITRRGITYGERNFHPHALQGLEDLPTKNVGLLFMCFQSSIANQFAFMQSQWIENSDFVQPGTGVDPVIGRKGDPVVAQSWPIEWGGPNMKQFSFSDFVHAKGGEFFFAPSLNFLRSLLS